MNRLRQVSEFLALRRNTSLLLVALLLAGTGEKLWLGFAPKYIETLGGSILIIGLFDALQTLLGAIYAYPGGWLTDHWGQRKSLLLFSAISIAGYVLVLVWQNWLALLLGSFLFLAWSALSLPATLFRHRHVRLQSQPPHDGRRRAIHDPPRADDARPADRRLAAHALRLDGRRALRARALHRDEPADGGVPMVHVRAGSRRQPPRLALKQNATPGRRAVPLPFSPSSNPSRPVLRELLVSDILIRFCERIPYAFIILWAMDHGGVTAQQFGYLVSV